MVYLYDACDQISDFYHQQLEKNATKNTLDGRTDRGKTVYPPSPLGSGGIMIQFYIPWEEEGGYDENLK